MDVRIGVGYDLHKLAAGRPFVLGGVRILHPKGPLGHSDGDALIHAVIDALLGAAGEGDIGRLFPDTDPRFKGACSLDLLEAVMKVIKKRRLRVQHVDAVVVVERPKIGPHVAAMKAALCPRLGLPEDRLGIKAKTNEGLGLIGRGGAVACWAVALLAETPRLRKR